MLKEELKTTRQYQRASKQCLYVNNVPFSFCVRFGLSPTELLVYCIIREFGRIGFQGVYSGSVKGICSYLNITKPTARKALEKLEEKGFLSKGEISRDGRKWICYEAIRFDMSEARESLEEQLDANVFKRTALKDIVGGSMRMR